MDTYGAVVVALDVPSGRYSIERAPLLAGFATDVLADGAYGELNTDEHGNLVVLGQVIYRPLRFAEGGRIVVCERVQ